MFKLRGHLTQINVDVGRYTKTLDQTMQTQMRQAARSWLRAIIPRIPVHTGAARASFKPLGAFLRVSIPIAPVARPRRSRFQASTFEFSKSGYVYTFTFNVNMFYITLNNYYDMSGYIPLIHPTPWQAFEAGEDAWQNYVETEMPKRFPRVENFIVTSRTEFR